ncbi:hypothetical protein Fisuc_2606 [Fibrobacter succinogenes subsp. succinogenes S85]|uniref:Uncharacterized protein n=1 Tax=Fibrobacter succinogenes (strain ATCC 19169 / S85) TaxID=59374 RepID=A0ABM5LKZ6_FIBSS|nr:hypothetical protein [Fibrobacter succinogenes]ACX76190.1 hypothetical protein Fisuc_2606 [Fibrobacter succinogenes subsp. succinogenes S85]
MNSIDFCTDRSYFTKIINGDFLDKVSSTETSIGSNGTIRILPRTQSDPRETADKRNADYNKALSMQPFDPLWMLTRQWQFGRFQGNDCGSPISVTVHAVKKKIRDADQSTGPELKAGQKEEDISPKTPLEYEVEKVNYEITPYVRVECAMYLKKMLIRAGLQSVVSQLEKRYALPDFVEEPWNTANSDKDSFALERLKTQKNKALKKFIAFYGKRSFDGYKVYLRMVSKCLEISLPSNEKKAFDEVQQKYISWLEKKFLPNNAGKNHWSSQKLAYEASMHEGNIDYTTDQYASGTLSWYSFDAKEDSEADANKRNRTSITKDLTYVPTPAKIPGAPAQRLWEFENRKVTMGNGEAAPEYIATAVVMQYVSTYSNDWMITPLETETGTVLDVEYIEVKNTFNETFKINKNAEAVDGNAASVGLTNRWCLFGSSRSDAYGESDFSCCKGLLFPPTVLRCEEGAPIEEVQFLRDEMANMLWGVETKINDGCGGFMDGQTLSDAVFKEVDKQRKDDKNATVVDAKYSLLIQNRVPLNWIPFIPEQLENGRDIIFRRGRMPIYYKCADDKDNDGYKSVRPSTNLLAVERDGKKVKPFYINEDQIGGYGIKVTKTPQRTRWFMGATFNWIGNRKIISEYQANSGLMFDELLKKDDGSVNVGRKDKAEDKKG